MKYIERIYRVLIVISASSFFIWLYFRKIFWEIFDEDTKKLLEFDGFGSSFIWTDTLLFFYLLVTVISYLGIFLYQKWAVWLFLALYVVTLFILTPFRGLEIRIPLEIILESVVLISDGAIISLVFFSDIKEKFIKRVS